MLTLPVTYSLDSDGVGWIVFDRPESRANVFDPPAQAGLDAAIDEAAASGARAVVVISAKERIFIAGADLNWLAQLPDAGAATAFSRAGQALFQKLSGLRMPVVCAIHGACAGGGYELALACHYRIASDAVATQIGLPEVGLGTIPGWGGTVRLARLIGPEAALGHMLQAKLIPAGQALAAGLVDELAPAAELKPRAKAAAMRLASAPVVSRRALPAAKPVYFDDLRRATQRKLRGQQPASLAVIDAVTQAQGLELAAALAVEARIFGEVTTGEVCRNLVAAFLLRDAAKKRTLAGWFPPVDRPAPIRRVGVVGAGVMGSGIAHALATAGYEVVLRDATPALAERGLGVIRSLLTEAVKRGRVTASEAARALDCIHTTAGWDEFASCDMVIEAIVEDLDAKRRLFSELAARVRPDTVLASNTSALPIEGIAGHVPAPERTLGVHFFNPVSRMPLVELVIGRDTSAESAARALGVVRQLGKSPVIARSSPGFLTTRVLFFYLNEAVRLWEQGVPTSALDGALRDFGWPMGPLRLIDEVGLDVTDSIFCGMEAAFPTRFQATATCRTLIAAGLRGRKNGTSSGFYRYQDGQEKVNEAVKPAVSTEAGMVALENRVLVDRLMGVMIAEAWRCLEEGVVRSADDVDFALLTGAGFPAFRGGLMRYARQTGRLPAQASLFPHVHR